MPKKFSLKLEGRSYKTGASIDNGDQGMATNPDLGLWASCDKTVELVRKSVHKMCTILTSINPCKMVDLFVILPPRLPHGLHRLVHIVIYITQAPVSRLVSFPTVSTALITTTKLI